MVTLKKTILSKLYEENEKEIADIHKEINMPNVNPYEERDAQSKQLLTAFFKECGLDLNDEFTEINDMDADPYEESKQIEGFSHWLGEEVDNIFFNGLLVGTMLMSCRGNSYYAEMKVSGKTFIASNSTEGNWKEKSKSSNRFGE